MKNQNENVSFRKSHIVLILRLVTLELILVILYLLVRIPKSILLPLQFSFIDSQVISVFGILYFISLSVIELILVLQIVLNWTNEEFEIREESLVHRRGIFYLKQQTYTLRNLGSANIYQGLIGKMLNFGTIIITSPILKNDIILPDIHNPQQVLRLLEDNIDQSSVKHANIIQRKS